MIVAIIIIIIIVLSTLILAIIRGVEQNEADQMLEDEEQIEYLRKWREENERKQILESDDVRRKKR